MATVTWGEDLAAIYDDVYEQGARPESLDPLVDLLTELAGDRPALELAVGTGRVALALHGRGVAVSGIELSPAMADRMAAKPGADVVPVVLGDMATVRVERPRGGFGLVYLVASSIMNVTTQQEQVAVFRNAAAHLGPGGSFVVEVVVPRPEEVPAGAIGRVFRLTDEHVGVETYDDPVGQIASSHHWMRVQGRLTTHAAPYRYVWPSELVLMGELAGLRLRDRWADWTRGPFTAQSPRQVAVFEKPEGADGPR